MEICNLSEKVRQAKDAVETLEEPLKTEAFKKILDKLLEVPTQIVQPVETQNNLNQKVIPTRKKSKLKSTNRGTAGIKLKKESEDKKRQLAEKLNRSEYQEVHKLKSILLKALFILKIMREKGVKCLTPPEIQFILREVFQIKQEATAISVSLNRKKAIAYTHRTRRVIGRTLAYEYEIMKDGEDCLKKYLGKNNNHVNEIDEDGEPDSI